MQLTTQITITDHECRPVSNPVAGWSEVDAELRVNEVVAGSFVAPARPELMEVLVPGNRVVIRDQGDIFKSGPIEGIFFERTVKGDTGAPGRVTVDFADDTAYLSDRITYPEPANPADAQVADDQWSGTDNAGDLMRSLVNLHAGPGALALRQVAPLILGTGAGLGPVLTYTTRYEDLLDALRTLALLGGGLIFEVRQEGRDLVFNIFAPRDRTAYARFSWPLGTLRRVSVDTQAPTATAAIVAGQGTGAARNIVERVDQDAADAWHRRIEVFIDKRQAETDTELEQAGDEAINDGRESITVETETVDSPQIVYGDTYRVGDLALVLPGNGATLTDIVRAVRLQVTPRTGRLRTALIGTQAAVTNAAWVATNRTLARRIAQMERI